MTPTISKLEQSMRSELELTCSLRTVLEQQQSAIAHLSLDGLDSLVSKEYQLLKMIQQTEKERTRALEAIIRDQPRPHQGRQDEKDQGFRIVVDSLAPVDAERLTELGDQLKREATHVVQLNRRLRILLSQSLRFVRESVGILTENFSRQLVDEKI